MINRDFAQMKDTFAKVYALHQWGNQQHLLQLMRDWPQIAGQQVSQLTRPAFFRKDVLWIYVQDSAWMQHMQYVKPDLLQRVNAALTGTVVADLRWQLQPADDREQPARTRRPPQPVDAEQRQLFRSMTASIGDAACKAALQRLWQAFHEQSR